jgi:hypothetical protein
MTAYLNPLLGLGGDVGTADGSDDGAVMGSSVDAGAGELIGLAVADGKGDGAATGEIGTPAPPKIVAPSVPPANARVENAGLNDKIAATTQAAIACERKTNPPSQLLVMPDAPTHTT